MCLKTNLNNLDWYHRRFDRGMICFSIWKQNLELISTLWLPMMPFFQKNRTDLLHVNLLLLKTKLLVSFWFFQIFFYIYFFLFFDNLKSQSSFIYENKHVCLQHEMFEKMFASVRLFVNTFLYVRKISQTTRWGFEIQSSRWWEHEKKQIIHLDSN